jgi:hypothetical protein
MSHHQQEVVEQPDMSHHQQEVVEQPDMSHHLRQQKPGLSALLLWDHLHVRRKGAPQITQIVETQ